MDWFLYDNGLRLERVKRLSLKQIKQKILEGESPTLITDSSYWFIMLTVLHEIVHDNLASKCMLNVNNRHARKRCEIWLI